MAGRAIQDPFAKGWLNAENHTLGAYKNFKLQIIQLLWNYFQQAKKGCTIFQDKNALQLPTDAVTNPTTHHIAQSRSVLHTTYTPLWVSPIDFNTMNFRTRPYKLQDFNKKFSLLT